MYVVMKCFSDIKRPAHVFASKERAMEYIQANESVFCTYTIEKVEYTL